jgi:hypothetical protein
VFSRVQTYKGPGISCNKQRRRKGDDSTSIVKVLDLGAKEGQCGTMLRRMAPHGDSLCDDVLICLIAQTGRQAGLPNHRQRVRSPLTAPAAEELLVAQACTKQPPRTCRVNCGCIVLKNTRPAHTWGEAGATQSLRKAFFCSVQPSCVHDRERDHKIVV